MGIEFSHRGSFDKTERFLMSILRGDIFNTLDRYGQEGVAALSAMTPIESGETANAWYYEIHKNSGTWSITWGNHHVESGVVIAVILQYGHGTGTGGYVQGRDYINPAIQPIFDRITEEAWKAVTSA